MMGFVQRAGDVKQQMTEHKIQCFWAEIDQKGVNEEKKEEEQPDADEPINLKAANLDVQVSE